MTRYNFGGSLADFAILPPSGQSNVVKSQPNIVTGTAWSAATGGTQYTDLLISGVASTVVKTDTNGFITRFQGPSDVTEIWVDLGGGSRFLLKTTDAHATLTPTGGRHSLTRRFYATAYGAVPVLTDATTTAANTVAIQAMMDAISSAGGGTGVLDGNFTISGTLYFRGNDVRLEGEQGDTNCQLVYTGTGFAFDTDSAAIRRRCGIKNLRIYCVTAGGSALRLWNSYRGWFEDVRFVANQGTTSTAVDFKGSRAVGFETSTYFNTFLNCDFLGSYASIHMGDDINRNRFIGGVIEGDGFAVLSDGTAYTSGTNMWIGVGIQTDATNAAGVVVQFGAPGGANVSYNWFNGCSFEAFTAGRTIVFDTTKALNNSIVGGSISADVSVTGADYGLNNNLVLVTNGSAKFAFPKEVSAPTVRLAGGTTSEVVMQSSAIKASGTGTNQALVVSSKGAAAVRVNSANNDGDRGLEAWTGGATSIKRVILGWGNDALRAMNDSGFDTVRLLGTNGRLYWCNPADGSLDFYLSRTAAGVLGINGATTGTTAPSAGGAGALPATPAGYITINVNGTDRKLPYY